MCARKLDSFSGEALARINWCVPGGMLGIFKEPVADVRKPL
jgi:hypothetical protein